MTLGKALDIIKSVTKTLEDKRNEQLFQCLWDALREFSENFEISLDTPSK
jgi:hypothetical protein